MIALDTNILVYAHRVDNPFQNRAEQVVRSLAEKRAPWAIPWPCVHEFLAVVTNGRIFKNPTPLENALKQVHAWLDSPSCELLTETERYWSILHGILMKAQVVGGQVHDARIAALCLTHEIQELWTSDRDFSRFADLSTRNPLTN